jgi:hypothetical protein
LPSTTTSTLGRWVCPGRADGAGVGRNAVVVEAAGETAGVGALDANADALAAGPSDERSVAVGATVGAVVDAAVGAAVGDAAIGPASAEATGAFEQPVARTMIMTQATTVACERSAGTVNLGWTSIPTMVTPMT